MNDVIGTFINLLDKVPAFLEENIFIRAVDIYELWRMLIWINNVNITWYVKDIEFNKIIMHYMICLDSNIKDEVVNAATCHHCIC